MRDNRAFELEPVSGKNNVWYEGQTRDVVFEGTDIKQNLLGTVGHVHVLLVERDNRQRNGLYYSEQWKIAKEAGLPVVPTLRKAKNGKVLMTDLTADGSEIFGKAMEFKLNGELDPNFYPRLSVKFLKVMENDQEGIVKKVKDYVDLASTKGIILPVDDPFELILHPDGTWDLVIIDLERLGKADPDENLLEENEKNAGSFIQDLKKIHSKLLKTQLIK